MDFMEVLSRVPGIPAYIVVFAAGIGVCYKVFKDFSRQSHTQAKDHLEAMSNVLSNPILKADPLILERLFLFVYGVAIPETTIRYLWSFSYPSEAFWRYAKASGLVKVLSEDEGVVFLGFYKRAGYRKLWYVVSTTGYWLFAIGFLLSFLTTLALFLKGNALIAATSLMMAIAFPFMAWISLDHAIAIRSAHILMKMIREQALRQLEPPESESGPPSIEL